MERGLCIPLTRWRGKRRSGREENKKQYKLTNSLKYRMLVPDHVQEFVHGYLPWIKLRKEQV